MWFGVAMMFLVVGLVAVPLWTKLVLKRPIEDTEGLAVVLGIIGFFMLYAWVASTGN